MSRVPGKFACRILIQEIGFALPVTITVPVVISLLITFWGMKIENPCQFNGTIPNYLFFKTPDSDDLGEFITEEVRNHCLLQKISYLQKPIIKCVKKSQLDAQIILSIFRQPPYVSDVSLTIIRRYNRMYTTIGTYYSFQMIVCCPGWIVPIQSGQQTL
jgi:hypothetical protein